MTNTARPSLVRAATTVCTEHGVEHQPRERAVRCPRCGVDTWHPHGEHPACAPAPIVDGYPADDTDPAEHPDYLGRCHWYRCTMPVYRVDDHVLDDPSGDVWHITCHADELVDAIF